MINRLRRLLAPNSIYRQLYPPPSTPFRIRSYCQDDRESLLNIHDLNAPGRFPKNHRPTFEKTLNEEHQSFFVAELSDGRIVGCGGVHSLSENVNVLYYGIIHPDFHGQGIGSCMTLSRLSFAARTRGVQFSIIYAVPTSLSFYPRFGYNHCQDWSGDDGKKYPVGVLSYDTLAFGQIDKVLLKRGYLLDQSLPIERDNSKIVVITKVDSTTNTIEIRDKDPNMASDVTGTDSAGLGTSTLR